MPADTFRQMSVDIQSLKRRFAGSFGRAATRAVRAPGRVNLIGEHTDYNDGFVLPIAIEREVAACLAERNDRTVTFASVQVGDPATVDLDGPIRPGQPAWANYPKGVLLA
jgi:galactokinase